MKETVKVLVSICLWAAVMVLVIPWMMKGSALYLRWVFS